MIILTSLQIVKAKQCNDLKGSEQILPYITYSVTSGIIIARLNIMKLPDSNPSDLHGLSEKSAQEFFSSWYCILLYHGYKAS